MKTAIIVTGGKIEKDFITSYITEAIGLKL